MINPLDIILVANTKMNFTLSVTNQQTGQSFDMTGFSAYWTVRAWDSLTPLIEKSTGAGSITIATSTLSWDVLPADTVNLQTKNYTDYQHEMIVFDQAGNPIAITNDDPCITWGKFIVRKQIAVPT